MTAIRHVPRNLAGGGGGGGSPDFGRVFFDDFASGNVSLWQQNAFYNMGAAVASGVDAVGPHSGTYCAQMNFNGLIAWNDPNAYTSLSQDSWAYTKEFFIRMWWRLDADFGENCGGCDFAGEGAKLMRLNQVGVGGGYFVNMIQSTTLHEQLINPDTGGIWSNEYTDNPLWDRAWHKIEFYLYQDQTNGIFKSWHDGTLITTYNGKTSSNADDPYYFMHLPSNWTLNTGWEHSATNHFYIDDVEIYSDDGTGGTGSMAAATAGVA